MRAVVTGGAGFIGSNLTRELLNLGHRVTVVDNFHTGSRENLRGLDAQVMEASCRKIGELGLRSDVVFHLGIPSSSPMYRRNPYLVGEAINDMLAVLEYVKGENAKLVFASSSSLYNGLPPPHRENMEVKVTDYYTECRLTVERLAELYAVLHGVQAVALRFFSVYGPQERAKGQYANVVTQFLWDLKEGRQPIIYGDGTQTRDFTYVTDVVEACLLAWMKPFQFEVFNVGTGRSTSFNEVVELLNKALGTDIKPRFIPNPVATYVPATQADTAKARGKLGFTAQVTLEEGIARLIASY
ncbi:MAG: NAD-dependent epimerase/dehydratase family protein [Candidatus Bathyarchaeia archaeon]